MEYKMEIWKDVSGYEGLYQVSNKGRVRSLDHTTTHRGFDHKKRGKILSVRKDGKGYHQYRLYKNGKSWYPKAHRLVAEHFIDNPNNFPQINHIDEDKDNNSVNNLEWCTGTYNMQQFFAKRYQLRSPEGQLITINNLSEFCRDYGLTAPNLHKTLKGTRQHHKGWVLCQIL